LTLEGVLVHQQFEPLAGGQFAALVLRVGARRPAPRARPAAAFFELFEDILHGRPARCPDAKSIACIDI
jgi:hypothetical protein